MIDDDVIQMFTKWKLSYKEWPFYISLNYTCNKIRIERIYNKNDKEDVRRMYNLVGDLFFEFEYRWQPLSNRQLAKLYGVNHQTMNNIINDAKARMMYEYKRPKRCI